MKTANRPNNVTAHAFFGARDPVLEQVLRKSLLEDRLPTIQIDDNAGRILQLLAMLHKPHRVIEIGSLFGYTTPRPLRGAMLPARRWKTAFRCLKVMP